MDYYFHNSIKSYTVALLDLFSDLHVPRFNSEGDQIHDIVLPVKFGNRDKAYMLDEHDIENLTNGNINTLPRAVIEFTGLTKAMDRNTNKFQKINKKKLEGASLASYEYHYNSVAYNFTYNVYIATRTFSDAAVLIEQIAPMFRPDLSIKIQELDIQEDPTTVPVSIGEFNIELPDELGVEDIRMVQVDFEVILQGNLYLPIKDQEIIKEVKIYTKLLDSKTELDAQGYGITSEVEIDSALISAKGDDNGSITEEFKSLEDTGEDNE